MGARIALVLFPLSVLLGSSGWVGAQAVTRTIDLGDGVVVTAQTTPLGVCALPLGPCTIWHAVGLDIARMDALLVARTYARVPGTSRILAAVAQPGVSYFGSAGMLYTDDRGATWNAARWPSANAAEAIAFSTDGTLGVAVGPSRSVWITVDRGLSWIQRASSAGVGYVDVTVLGDAIVIVDGNREAWRSRDRAFSFESVASEVDAPLAIVDDTIVVSTERGARRVSADGRLLGD